METYTRAYADDNGFSEIYVEAITVLCGEVKEARRVLALTPLQ